ncbi:hypothetical protein [Halapricum desulfuricans]|uniref:Uncharacterized protein n=1 Tax=Halapricum desulfuricans TaxID=2841257 RepID=A0A897NCP9_9EURY|nr:hypothetical protein [Halapricum desulfuricans]QSG08833.1 Uncharacterized protein HSR122_1437 [Halapricum desulfuricans]
MSERSRFGRHYIETELQTIAEQLETSVKAYLVGGGAMSLRDLKETTKDVKLQMHGV